MKNEVGGTGETGSVSMTGSAGMTGGVVETGGAGETAIVEAVLKRFPDAQAVYLFGSSGTRDERPESDVDIALLLPPKKATETGTPALDDLRFELESIHLKDIDLINLRKVSTVLQKEVVTANRRIYCADKYAADEFEMLTLSLYQKLNEERAGILMDATAGGRFFGK
jgi:predicted nucleotidyltransferase